MIKEDKVFLTAEAGATHTGLESAKTLVDIAIEAGFDAVKFQIVESDKCPFPDEMFNGHRCQDIWKQRELTKDEWLQLWYYCKDKITAFVTLTDVNQVGWFPSDTYKISSRNLTKLSFISFVSQHCKTIQFDTGGATIEQILDAIDIVGIPYIIHYCPSGYPAKPELKKIKDYIEKFHCPVGFSTHDNNPYTTCMAIALGAKLIEVPIIEMVSDSISPERIYALNSWQARDFVRITREAEKSL